MRCSGDAWPLPADLICGRRFLDTWSGPERGPLHFAFSRDELAALDEAIAAVRRAEQVGLVLVRGAAAANESAAGLFLKFDRSPPMTTTRLENGGRRSHGNSWN